MMSRRGALAAAIVALWIGGMAMMVNRIGSRSEEQLLADVSLRVQPATYYYIIERDGERIGAASSLLDTTANSLVSQEYFVGNDPVGDYKIPTRISARWLTKLTRGLHLVDTNADVSRATKPFSISGMIQNDSSIVITSKQAERRPAVRYSFTPPLFTPAIAPVVFMLGGKAEIGRRQSFALFDPMTRTVTRQTLRIRAESLFTVVDSAMTDAGGGWIAAHSDTVRAWQIEGAPHGLSAWVDADGRIVSAQAGSLSATRTAFEIAFKNSKTK
jgi:hypothetical protein